VNTNQIQVRGTADASTVRVRVFDGATALADTGPLSGGWSVALGFDAGPHELTAVGFDSANDASPASAAVPFTIDQTAPAAPTFTSPAEGATLGFTDITVEGLAEPGARVRVTISSGGTLDAVAAADGAWSARRTFTDAIYTLVAVATDAAGNASPQSAPLHFRTDTIPPIPPRITTPGDGSATASAVVTIGGSAEPGVAVEVLEGSVIASTTARADGIWTVGPTFAPGTHFITSRAIDQVGHVSALSTNITFTVDQTAPPPPVIDAPGEESVLRPSQEIVTGTAEPGASILVSQRTTVIALANADASGDWSVRLSLPNGPAVVTARARDAAGNLSDPSDERHFTVDGIAPSVRITTPDGVVFLPGDHFRVAGTAADTFGVSNIVLDFYDAVGRGIAGTSASCSGCPFSTTVTWSGTLNLLPGRYIVKAYAVDRAGNRSDLASIAVVKATTT
jgi:hypothetical protein